MRTRKTNLLFLFVILTMSLTGAVLTASAQSGSATQRPSSDTKTDTRILYHNGPVVTGVPAVYVIWYGCWADNCGFAGDTASQFILTEFLASLGSSPYFQFNSTYPNSSGQIPSGALMYGGAAVDRYYSHGVELTASDIQGIISDQVLSSGASAGS